MELTTEQEQMLNMLHFTIWQKSYEECGFRNIKEGFSLLKQDSVMFAELLELLRLNYDHIDFIDKKVDFGFECPLDLHCTYTMGPDSCGA